MFDFSYGELLVLGVMGTFVIGKKDLPKACHFAGRQVGRVVGLLQGARARADRYAMDNEMKALQNELRMGLRELDAVKGELAVASTSGLLGRGLGSTLSGANRMGGMSSSSSIPASPRPPLQSQPQSQLVPPQILGGTSLSKPFPSPDQQQKPINYLATASAAAESGMMTPPSSPLELAPRAHSVAAVAEEQWQKRGIGFVSKAEMGAHRRASGSGNDSSYSPPGGGSFLLADIMQESLIHDQYDRAVKEQDDLLRSKAELIQSKHKNQPDERSK